MKQKRNLFHRLLAVMLSLAMVLTMTPPSVWAVDAEAPTTASQVWKKAELGSLTEEDSVAITMTTSADVTYILPVAAATNAGPAAEVATVSDDTLTPANAAAAYTWKVIKQEDGGYAFQNADGKYLSTNNANAGVRISSSDVFVWSLDDAGAYLKTDIVTDTATTTRYLGVYTTKPDWRAYNNTTGNTAGQTVSFWKLTTVEAGEVPAETESESESEAPVVEDIEKFMPSAAYEGTLTAGTTLALKCGTIADVVYEVSTDGTEWTALEGSSYTIPEGEPGEYVVKVRASKDGVYSQTLELSYTIEAEPEAVTVTATQVSEVQDGDIVYIYYVKGSSVMTATETGTAPKTKLTASAAATVVDGVLTVTPDMLALKAEVDADGNVALATIDGRYLTSAATGNGLSLSAKNEYSLWTIAEGTVSEESGVYITNANAVYNNNKQALEYYNGFTTYTAKETDAYLMRLFKQDTAEGVSSIKDARAMAADAAATVEGTVVYVSGKNVYVQDFTGGICLYFTAAPSDVKVGDLVRASGVKTTYKGLEELKSVSDYVVISSGNLLPGQTVTLADLAADTEGSYECTRVQIENVTLGAINATGNTAITDADGNTINIYKGAFGDYKEGDVVTLWATVSDFNGYQLYVASADDITLIKAAEPEVPAETESESESESESASEPESPSETESAEEGETLPATIADGTYVIWNPNYNITLANLFNGSGYVIGETISGDLKAVTGYSNASLWTVTAVDGGYTIEQGGVPVGTNASNKLAIGDTVANKVWTITRTEDGQYYNLNCSGQYLEWYANYSDWSTYKSISTANTALFQLWLTPASAVYDVNAEMTEAIAQWGGGGPYADDILSVKGDAYEVGDQKDSSSVYTAVVSGKEVKPFTTGTSSTTGITNYYMGGTGLGSGSDDYIQFALSTAGYGKLSVSFRLRSSNTGAGEYQVQYSTDGKNFTNLTTGSYSCGYTKYNSDGTSEPVSLSGSITDGIAKTSIKSATYVSFTFDLPAGAENADSLLLRLVPNSERADGKTGGATSGGTLRADSVVITGSPIVDKTITSWVVVDPDGVEEDQTPGTALTMTCQTEDALIQYRFVYADAAEEAAWQTYNDTEKPVLPTTLPVTLQVKATCEGKADSIVRTLKYAAGTVASVKVSPNGGGVFISGDEDVVAVTLSCETDGATIYYNTDESDTYAEYTEDTKIELKKGFGSLVVKTYAVKEGFKDSSVTTRKFTERSQESYNIYFGQLHAHTSYSDGAGTAEDAYKHASNVKNLDFLALADHSNSFDNAGSSVLSEDASAISEEWKEGKELAKTYTTEDFTSLFGFEMTWSNGLGHINTFNTPGFQSRTQSAYSTYSTALQNYYETLKTVSDSISQFNHPGTTFGDFSDFAYYDEEIDPLITLIEVGNGEGAIGSSGYFPSYEYYTRALDKGWHVAPTNNQDNHKGLWGDANTGRSVVLADTQDEDAIYDAMRNYRVYATEDNDLNIYYTLDGNIMGSILSKDDVGDEVTLSVKVKDPTDSAIGKVQVVVNGGLVIAEKEVASSEEEVTFKVGADYSYYYIKITEEDKDIAVTAPVWVGSVEACGISEFATSQALQVQDEALDLNLTLYNNETKPLEVTKIEVEVTDSSDVTKTIKTISGTELEEAGIAKVAKLSTASYSFDYTYSGLGTAIFQVTVTGVLDGVEKVYTEKLELNYVPQSMVTNVVVDGSHYNDYVTGYYGGNMGNFTTIAAQNSVKVTIAGNDKAASDRGLTEAEWTALLEDCALLVVSAPARTSGTANAGDYKASEFEDWFLALVKDYVDKGGSVIVCGLADYQDKKAASTANHAAAQLNKLLEAVGSSMKINDDEICDDTNNGGQVYRMYPENFNMKSLWTEGIIDKASNADNYQKYSQYSGCSVDAGNGTWLVQGFDTTYSIDSDGDKIGGIAVGNQVNFMATEATAAGGNVFAAGGVFLSDFEIKVEMDNQFDLPYANKTIAENILAAVKKELPVSPISEVRTAANAGETGSVYRVQGTVTVGRSNENNAFFDCIYIQDETAGIDIFPISDDSINVGAKIEITGYIDSYQGDLELKVMSYKLLDNENLAPLAPTELTCKEASDYAANGGLLTSVTGIVKTGSVYYNSDGTLAQFVVTDETGDTTIFIDGYILSGTSGKNELAGQVKEGCKVSAVGVQYMHPESFVPGVTDNVSVLRVRDCDEIKVLAEPEVPSETESESEPESPSETESASEPESPSETESASEPESPSETESASEPESPSETESESPAEKLQATIKADDIRLNKSILVQRTTIKVTTNSDGAVTFTSSDSSVKVSDKGVVTIPSNYKGTATITIRTAETDKYQAGETQIEITVGTQSIIQRIVTTVKKVIDIIKGWF